MITRHALGLLVAAVLMAVPAALRAEGDVKEGDFSTGWNTWKDAKEGDWVLYSVGGLTTVRHEITQVSGSKITIVTTSGDAKPKEKTRTWDQHLLQVEVPKKLPVTWETSEVEFGDETIKCQVAKWVKEGTPIEVSLSNKIPCGGVVKQGNQGKITVWLMEYCSDGKTFEGNIAEHTGMPEDADAWPDFFKVVGNSYVVMTTKGDEESFAKHTVLKTGDDTAVIEIQPCDIAGEPVKGRVRKETVKRKDWLEKYATPTREGEIIKIADKDYACDVFEPEKKDDAERTDGTTSWVHKGMILKSITIENDIETVTQAIMIDLTLPNRKGSSIKGKGGPPKGGRGGRGPGKGGPPPGGGRGGDGPRGGGPGGGGPRGGGPRGGGPRGGGR